MGITLILLALGFVLLVKGADMLVDGSVELAKRLRISNLLIGLTIVSFGTSLPEMVVNLFASAGGNTELAIANIIGSNIANIFLILGTAALIMPLCVPKGTVWREVPFSLLAIIVLAILANDGLLNGFGVDLISRSDGMVMMLFLVLFMYYIYHVAKNDRKKKFVNIEEGISIPRSLLYLGLGLAGLVVGGNWVVNGAVSVAEALGISTTLIGLTVVAIGTSLPELVTSVVAAYKKNTELAVGNAVGSNIFNILWILGLSAIIRPLPFASSSNFDVLMVVLATFLLFTWMFVGKKHTLQRWQGVLFLFLYAGYIMLVINRG
ncbi:MAG: calcium/sodium antiporter [Patescibacteria group bacterium]|nr:calcium/sodium antiporter [Patescibacteria group bacterium]